MYQLLPSQIIVSDSYCKFKDFVNVPSMVSDALPSMVMELPVESVFFMLYILLLLFDATGNVTVIAPEVALHNTI